MGKYFTLVFVFDEEIAVDAAKSVVFSHFFKEGITTFSLHLPSDHLLRRADLPDLGRFRHTS